MIIRATMVESALLMFAALHRMPCYANRSHDAGSLFRTAEDETGSPHIGALLDAPSEIASASGCSCISRAIVAPVALPVGGPCRTDVPARVAPLRHSRRARTG